MNSMESARTFTDLVIHCFWSFFVFTVLSEGSNLPIKQYLKNNKKNGKRRRRSSVASNQSDINVIRVDVSVALNKSDTNVNIC
jgi:hypothetical protein